MRLAIQKAILSLFPELTGKYHLPLYARVIGVSEPTSKPEISDPFRNRYAVDIEVLDAQDKKDDRYPIFKNVVLPMPLAGQEAGMMRFPDAGTRVVLAFASGLPSQPFIMQVLPVEMSLPELDVNELNCQARTGVFNKADRKGNLISNTFAKIINKSFSRDISAVSNNESYRKSYKKTKGIDIEEVHTKVIEALGSVEIAAGGMASIMSGESLNLTTAKNLQQFVRKKMVSVSGVSQSTKSPKTYIGSDDHNLLVIVSEIAQAVIDLANACAAHNHTSAGSIVDHSFIPGTSSAPGNASSMSSAGSKAGTEKGKVDGITL